MHAFARSSCSASELLQRWDRLPSVPESVARARGIVGDFLAEAGVCDDLAFAARLVASELATNAVRHSGSADFDVHLTVMTDLVVLDLGDGGRGALTGHMVAHDATGDAESLRGLRLVDAYADSWDVHFSEGAFWRQFARSNYGAAVADHLPFADRTYVIARWRR